MTLPANLAVDGDEEGPARPAEAGGAVAIKAEPGVEGGGDGAGLALKLEGLPKYLEDVAEAARPSPRRRTEQLRKLNALSRELSGASPASLASLVRTLLLIRST